MRRAWKVRLAGWPPRRRAGAGMAARMMSTSWPVDSTGRAAAMARQGLEHRPGVAATANGGVDEQARGHRPEQVDHAVDHHRQVREPLAHPQPPDRTGTVGMSPRSM